MCWSRLGFIRPTLYSRRPGVMHLKISLFFAAITVCTYKELRLQTFVLRSTPW